MAMPREQIRAWAEGYIRAQLDPDLLKPGNSNWWAVEWFISPSSEVSSDDCWAAILEVLAREPPDKVIEVLAAGPLENLIHEHGIAFIERIETEARRNPEFRNLLGGVWESSTPEIWARVQKARGPLW